MRRPVLRSLPWLAVLSLATSSFAIEPTRVVDPVPEAVGGVPSPREFERPIRARGEGTPPTSHPATAPAANGTAEEQMLRAIYTEALTHGQAFENLRVLVSNHPGRLAGSPALANAIGWARETIAAVKPDRVFTQDVLVPHWERGETESVFLLDGAGMRPLAACALGGSGASPDGGLLADVVEVHSLDELNSLDRAKVEGRIVFFNGPMEAATVHPGAAYGAMAGQRTRGPAAAARLGAKGALVRSLTQRIDDVPHTGVTIFPPDVPKIPAAALSALAADRLSRAVTEARRNSAVLRVQINIHAQWFPDAPSQNVIGEVRGSEFPNEILLVGGHLDSWDIAAGAHDDGAGVVQSIEVLRIFRALGIKPRHTIRCVAFTNEENGTAGGKGYAKFAAEAGEKHLLALESDSGGFQPQAVWFANAAGDAAARAQRWLPLLRGYGIYDFHQGDAGTDVTPLVANGGVAAETYTDSQRYFDIHHTREDTLDKVNPRELELGAAAMASLLWLVDSQGL